MGAGQILRAAVAAALIGALAAPTTPAWARPQPPDPAPLAIGIVDARAPGEPPEAVEAVASVVRGIDGVRLPLDDKLEAALTGQTPVLAALARARARRREAMSAYAELRCHDASTLAEDAALAFLATAPPDQVRDELAHLLAIMLLCADQAGDYAGGFAAVERLRRLGFTGSPPGVPDELWARYPEADVLSNRQTVKVALGSAPADGARVWIDLVEVGVTPLEVRVEPGRHWVSMTGRFPAAAAFDARASTPPVTLTLEPADWDANPWQHLTLLVAQWRRGGGEPREKLLLEVMRDAGLVLTVVLVHADGGEAEAQIWARQGNELSLVGSAKLSDSQGISAAVRAGVERVAPPASGLGREPPRPDRSTSKPIGWETWAFLGAIVVGAATVFLVTEAGDSTQRIEVSFP